MMATTLSSDFLLNSFQFLKMEIQLLFVFVCYLVIIFFSQLVDVAIQSFDSLLLLYLSNSEFHWIWNIVYWAFRSSVWCG